MFDCYCLKVIVCFRSDREAAEALLASLPGDGHSCSQCDVSDPEACLRLVEKTQSRYGRLDGEHWSRSKLTTIAQPFFDRPSVRARCFALHGSAREQRSGLWRNAAAVVDLCAVGAALALASGHERAGARLPQLGGRTAHGPSGVHIGFY